METVLFLAVLLGYLAVLGRSGPEPAPHGIIGHVRAGLAELQRLDAVRQQRFACWLDELAGH